MIKFVAGNKLGFVVNLGFFRSLHEIGNSFQKTFLVILKGAIDQVLSPGPFFIVHSEDIAVIANQFFFAKKLLLDVIY